MRTVLVVDDEPEIREWMRTTLEYAKFDVRLAHDGPAALERVRQGGIDLVFLDIRMPGMDGIKVLEEIRKTLPSLPVVMVSGVATIDEAVAATRLGAYEVIVKPPDLERLLIVARNAIELKTLRERLEGKDAILGESPRIRELLSLIERVGPTDARVLITGENGTGKELVAHAIHRLSRRASRQLVEVNCAAIPNELIESELFGHERGAFTGASGQRIGKFEVADGGTILLDEIGDMSPGVQAKVLRALEEGRIERLGGNRQIAVDVRVIAATNRNLREAIARGDFREDLYHRLNVIPIRVPPLRERREDIPLLAGAFAADICARNGMAPRRFTPALLARLQAMEWTGNVRELRNTVERLVIMVPGTEIDVAHLEREASRPPRAGDDLLAAGGTFQEFKDRAEAAYIRKVLAEKDGNVSQAAEALDIQRSHLYNKMKKYGLTRGDRGER